MSSAIKTTCESTLLPLERAQSLAALMTRVQGSPKNIDAARRTIERMLTNSDWAPLSFQLRETHNDLCEYQQRVVIRKEHEMEVAQAPDQVQKQVNQWKQCVSELIPQDCRSLSGIQQALLKVEPWALVRKYSQAYTPNPLEEEKAAEKSCVEMLKQLSHCMFQPQWEPWHGHLTQIQTRVRNLQQQLASHEKVDLCLASVGLNRLISRITEIPHKSVQDLPRSQKIVDSFYDQEGELYFQVVIQRGNIDGIGIAQDNELRSVIECGMSWCRQGYQARTHQARTTDLLLKAGANVNPFAFLHPRSSDNPFALHAPLYNLFKLCLNSMWGGTVEDELSLFKRTVKSLLDGGADPNWGIMCAADANSNIVAQRIISIFQSFPSSSEGDFDLSPRLEKVRSEVMNQLVDAGMDVDALSISGGGVKVETLLMRVPNLTYTNLEKRALIKTLISNGAMVNKYVLGIHRSPFLERCVAIRQRGIQHYSEAFSHQWSQIEVMKDMPRELRTIILSYSVSFIANPILRGYVEQEFDAHEKAKAAKATQKSTSDTLTTSLPR